MKSKIAFSPTATSSHATTNSMLSKPRTGTMQKPATGMSKSGCASCGKSKMKW